MKGTAVERGAKPSAHGRSEIFPAMSRLLTPEENVRTMAANPGMEPPHRASPLNRLFSSLSFQRCGRSTEEPDEPFLRCSDGEFSCRRGWYGVNCLRIGLGGPMWAYGGPQTRGPE